MKTKPCNLKNLLNIFEQSFPLDFNKIFGRKAPVYCEIGFGMGEILIEKAKQNPHINFIGIEQIWERVYKTLREITKLQLESDDPEFLNNIRILNVDAKVAFHRLISMKSLDYIYSLFPCPWPKKSHIKHRLFSSEFLKCINSRLKNKGVFYLVTDYEEFNDWVLEQQIGCEFFIKRDLIPAQFGTKFERKWLEEGQKEFYEITMEKEKHVKIPIVKNSQMKTYRLKTFDPEQFIFENITGRMTYILKDRFFDPKKQSLHLHFLISEPEMNQNFWIEILKKDTSWVVKRADGQNFFQTEGIIGAMKAVHQAALNKPQ